MRRLFVGDGRDEFEVCEGTLDSTAGVYAGRYAGGAGSFSKEPADANRLKPWFGARILTPVPHEDAPR